MAKVTDATIKEAFSQLNAARSQRLELEKEVKSLKAVEDAATAILADAIPEDSARAGITHATQRKVSVSYSDYTKALIDLIPKSKKPVAVSLKDSFTKESFRSVFKAVK